MILRKLHGNWGLNFNDLKESYMGIGAYLEGMGHELLWDWLGEWYLEIGQVSILDFMTNFLPHEV